MFWVLTAMALAFFAPCVLVPIWQEVEQVREYRREMAAVIEGMEKQVVKNQARIDGLREDPLVNERIARRELNYRLEQEQIVRVTSQELAALRVRPADPLLASEAQDVVVLSSLHWTQALTRWLPAWPYRELFGKPNNRRLLMLMSAGLLFTAFILYGRTPAGRTATR